METKNTHIMYGFISGIAMVLTTLIIHLTGATFVKGMGYVAYIPFLIGILLNATAFSKANDGYVTFKKVFGSCFKATMIVAICMVAWSLISMIVFPNMKEMAIEAARKEMAKNPQMTDDAMDMALNITRKYWNIILVASAIFGTMFYGAIFSLIGGGIATKNGERPMTSDNY